MSGRYCALNVRTGRSEPRSDARPRMVHIVRIGMLSNLYFPVEGLGTTMACPPP